MINAKKGETIVDEEDKAEGVGHSKQGAVGGTDNYTPLH